MVKKQKITEEELKKAMQEQELPEIPEMTEEELQKAIDNKGAVTEKKELLAELTKSNISKNLSKEFWHFTSNNLSSGFPNTEDEKELRDGFFLTAETKLKNMSIEEVPNNFFDDLFQVFLHTRTRQSQAKGTINGNRTNLLTLITKIHQVMEQKIGGDNIPKRGYKIKG